MSQDGDAHLDPVRQPEPEKIVHDLGYWDFPLTEDPDGPFVTKQVKVIIRESKLTRAIQDAASKHDGRKVYANGAFEVEVRE
ncbi:MAG: hypothetical protein AAF797_06255 [Planctomycetota bacterium]